MAVFSALAPAATSLLGGVGSTASSPDGPTSAESKLRIGRDQIVESGRVYFAPNPIRNLASEILLMQGTPENGGKIDFMPNRIATFLNGRDPGNAGTFSVDLGSVSGAAGIGTLAVVGVALVAGFFLIRRVRSG